ncbi:hypothetical protein ACIGB6_06605 [Paeniglutamicibacter gangotriensis]|uniref:hypothetical protein n=1 Tax=Paeniglutamicibacter gangotriensis TaxID=254787 RepID=UPI0037CC6528
MKTMSRETTEEELEALYRVIHFIRQSETDENLMSTIFPVSEQSSMYKDNEVLPELSLPDFVQMKLTFAYGHLAAFARWLGVEGDPEVHSIQALPFGGYALLRPVLECAGEALWVMKPENRQTRLRRRLTAQADEIVNAARFLKDSNSRNQAQVNQKIAKLDNIADRLKLGQKGWSPWKDSMTDKRESKHTPISNMLTEVESMRDSEKLGFESTTSWSASWRACSGATHGQSWPITTLNEAISVPGTRKGHSVEHNIFAKFESLALVTHASCDLLATAFDRADGLANHLRK